MLTFRPKANESSVLSHVIIRAHDQNKILDKFGDIWENCRSLSIFLKRPFIITLNSVGDNSLFVSFVCLFVCSAACLSVSPFSQPCLNTVTFTLVSYPGMVNH